MFTVALSQTGIGEWVATIDGRSGAPQLSQEIAVREAVVEALERYARYVASAEMPAMQFVEKVVML